MLHDAFHEYLRGKLIQWVRLRKRHGETRDQVLDDLGLIVDEVYRK